MGNTSLKGSEITIIFKQLESVILSTINLIRPDTRIEKQNEGFYKLPFLI